MNQHTGTSPAADARVPISVRDSALSTDVEPQKPNTALGRGQEPSSGSLTDRSGTLVADRLSGATKSRRSSLSYTAFSSDVSRSRASPMSNFRVISQGGLRTSPEVDDVVPHTVAEIDHPSPALISQSNRSDSLFQEQERSGSEHNDPVWSYSRIIDS